MNRVLEINVDDLDCRVQAGVTREQVNAELKGHRVCSSPSTPARMPR
jgi:FAD/FMN-containing dehydrogenase